MVLDSCSLLAERRRVRVRDTRPQGEGIQDRLVEGTEIAKARHMEAEAMTHGDILVQEPEDIRLVPGQVEVVDYTGPGEGDQGADRRNPVVGCRAVVKSLEQSRTRREVLRKSVSLSSHNRQQSS